MRGARPQRSLELTIERGGAFRRGERVLVACSGGPDSVALAGAVAKVAKALRLSVAVAHVNHAVRASAGQDECVALAVATHLGLPFRSTRLCEPDPGEGGLREARYAALEAAAREWGATAVATAHHAEDQSETVLLALFRGAGPQGLAGMPLRRPLGSGIDVVRPVLGLPAARLVRYCHANGLPYAVDPTNADAGVRRNAVREALEALRPLFPGLDEAVARAAVLVGDEESAPARAALRHRVRESLRVEQELRDVDFNHVEAAVRAIEMGASGTFLMKAGVSLEIRAGVISGITKS